jgi:hypothetical protein
MARYVDLYDDRNYYIGEDGEYQKWNIDPKVIEEAADVVEVVRCKDCKYYAGEGMYCANDIIVQFDHFYCYYGERRTDNA